MIRKSSFQSTSPVWRTTLHAVPSELIHGISIHVPRVEDDLTIRTRARIRSHFNPRPPCGGRLTCGANAVIYAQFQSTSPVWRTTLHAVPSELIHGISIHVPRVEDDLTIRTRARIRSHFNPRPPCGGRPRWKRICSALVWISIHVPRVEDDTAASYTKRRKEGFQSTSPVWRTTNLCYCRWRWRLFQSTSPVWRTTSKAWGVDTSQFISIHVPRVEDDATTVGSLIRIYPFQSTSPVWRTTGRQQPQRWWFF